MTNKIDNLLKEYKIDTKKMSEEEKLNAVKKIIKNNNKIINISRSKLNLLLEINKDIKNYLEKEDT